VTGKYDEALTRAWGFLRKDRGAGSVDGSFPWTIRVDEMGAPSLLRKKSEIVLRAKIAGSRLMRASLVTAATAAIVTGTLAGAGASHADEPSPTPTPTPMIIGGEEADQPYPFMVSFQTERNGDPNSHRCSGFLVAKNWVVTAAHCVVQPDGQGSFKFRDFTPYHLQIGNNDRTQGTVAKIRGAAVPPDFRWDDNRALGKDIALVQLDRNVSHPPVRLASRLPGLGTLVREVGWGYTSLADVGDPTKLPVVLRQLDTKVISPRTPLCIAFNGDDSFGIRDGDICVDNPDGQRGTCSGDSGSPLLTKVYGRWVAVGVNSRATEDVCGTTPDIYTGIGPFRGWIHQMTGA
jgi:secreted trypsin-like serine protease